MDHRVDLDFVGLGQAAAAYGGYLCAWSFIDTDGPAWFDAFRIEVLSAVGRKYLPIYRMGDGEYRFLMGRRFNAWRRPIWREGVAVLAERVGIRSPHRWKTSWGEHYRPEQTRSLRARLIDHIRDIAEVGYLACYINDNGLHAFTEYNRVIAPFLQKNGVKFNSNSYVPFHFAPSLLISKGWRQFIADRRILIVTGLDDEKERLIRRTLQLMGARCVEGLAISATSSMVDQVDLSSLSDTPDLCLVAAGIGSANILSQLRPIDRPCIDIGGLMDCFAKPSVRQHGGVIGLPQF